MYIYRLSILYAADLRRFVERSAFAVAVCTVCFLLQSCVLPAHLEVDRTASDLGFSRNVVSGKPFQHVIYQSDGNQKTDKLHVYIEGDGVAWRMRHVISSDPTPRRPLMLQLMSMDPANALYVGRPCYFGQVTDRGCHSDLWTYSRFSSRVVESMANVIRQKSSKWGAVVLIGHSGGGALAMLLAEYLSNVDSVVTVAGNLDVQGWTKHHKYTPLSGSLNPATRPPLPASIRQLHLLGGRDKVVPPALVSGWISAQPNAERWFYNTFDHACCWQKRWPDVLRWIDNRAPRSF